MGSAEVTLSDDKANSDKDRRKRGDGDDKKKKKGDKGDKVAKIDIPQNCVAKNAWNRICFGYNRKSCPVRGARCRKGWQAPLSSDFGHKE